MCLLVVSASQVALITFPAAKVEQPALLRSESEEERVLPCVVVGKITKRGQEAWAK